MTRFSNPSIVRNVSDHNLLLETYCRLWVCINGFYTSTLSTGSWACCFHTLPSFLYFYVVGHFWHICKRFWTCNSSKTVKFLRGTVKLYFEEHQAGILYLTAKKLAPYLVFTVSQHSAKKFANQSISAGYFCNEP